MLHSSALMSFLGQAVLLVFLARACRASTAALLAFFALATRCSGVIVAKDRLPPDASALRPLLANTSRMAVQVPWVIGASKDRILQGQRRRWRDPTSSLPRPQQSSKETHGVIEHGLWASHLLRRRAIRFEYRDTHRLRSRVRGPVTAPPFIGAKASRRGSKPPRERRPRCRPVARRPFGVSTYRSQEIWPTSSTRAWTHSS